MMHLLLASLSSLPPLHVAAAPPVMLADIISSLNGIVGYLVTLVAAVFAFMFTIAGYHYLTAGDDIQAKANAKRAMGGAITGLIIVGTAVATAAAISSQVK